MSRARAWFSRQPGRVKFVIVFAPLMVGGMILNATQPQPDNVTHKPAICQRVVWNTTTGRYIVINYEAPKGGGCK